MNRIGLGFHTLLGKNGTLIRSLCCPSACLYFKNARRYRVEIQTIYSDLQPHDFLKKNISHLLKKIYGRLYHKIMHISTISRESKLIWYFLELSILAASIYR